MLSRPQGHSAAGRLNHKKKNPNDLIGNQIHDRPACSAVPQPTVPPRAANEDTNKKGKVIPLQARCGPEGG